MFIIFLLLLMFFRQMKVILAPMVVAMMSVIWAMGLLIMALTIMSLEPDTLSRQGICATLPAPDMTRRKGLT